MIGKYTYVKGRQERLTLDDKEYDDLMERLLENNAKELERCLKKAKEICEKNKELDVFETAMTLFDKQATASFSAITDALQEKEMAMKRRTA